MVYDLATLRKINAVPLKADKTPKPFVPEKLALNPAAARAFVNRPWTREELGGKESVYEAYARSEREPFRNQEPKAEPAKA